MKLFKESNFIKSVYKIGSDKPIILYGASIYTVWYTEEWRRYFNKDFGGCVCDGDEKIQGLSINGHEILSPKHAFEKFPDGFVFITSINYKSSIISNLLTKYNISREKILNFESIEFKRSCIYARNLFFIHEKVSGSNSDSNLLHICEVDLDLLKRFSDNYETLPEEFVNFRDETLQLLSENNVKECLRCEFNKEGWFIKHPKINIYNLAAEGVCNFRCRYCIYSFTNSSNPFNFRKSLEALHNDGLLADDLHIDLTYAEIMIHPNRKEILNAAAEFAETLSIATNASVFDETVYEILKSRRANLIVSLDAGTHETFAAIKGVDCFDKVVSNLKKYASVGQGSVNLKFVILKGINDGEEEINAFIDLCLEIGVLIVTISNDFFSADYNDMSRIEYMSQKLYENGILCKIMRVK